jgi:hypothetical protein
MSTNSAAVLFVDERSGSRISYEDSDDLPELRRRGYSALWEPTQDVSPASRDLPHGDRPAGRQISPPCAALTDHYVDGLWLDQIRRSRSERDGCLHG